jgi:hypothetical protein
VREIAAGWAAQLIVGGQRDWTEAVIAGVAGSWAISFRNAIRSQGGMVIAQDFLNPETLITMGTMAPPMD